MIKVNNKMSERGEYSRNSEYTAIILAAGGGARIGQITNDPKALLKVSGKSFLERHLESLGNLGIRKVIISVGYKNEKILEHLRPYLDDFEIDFDINEGYETNGNGYAMHHCLKKIKGGALVFDGDLIYEHGILKRFVEDSRGDSILVGKGSLRDVECAKTLVDSRGLVAKTVDKREVTGDELSMYNFVGEAIGIIKFSDQGRRGLIEVGETFFSRQENVALNWEHLLNSFFEKGNEVHPHYDESEMWMEVDDPDDYREAIRKFETK
jgi:choline kinase